MRVAVIGCGYVGLVSGACLAEIGHDVCCVDIDARKIDGLKIGQVPLYEPGLESLVRRNIELGNLSFTTSLGTAIEGAKVVFVAVGTPARQRDGFADLSYVYDCVRELAAGLRSSTVIVMKSTVPVGSGDRVEEIIGDLRPDAEFSVASNPEFLREGMAIADFMRPDRIVIGSEEPAVRRLMAELYRPLTEAGAPIFFCSRRSAELSKYACNAFLATKVSFVNEMADLCEKVGADIRDIAPIMGSDVRIGPRFLAAGPGYGGSCLPKDVQALARTAQDYGSPLRIIETVAAVNDQRKRAVARRIAVACGGSLSQRTIGLLGLTFKAETDDMRDAPSIALATALHDAGASIRAYDPHGMEAARKVLPEPAVYFAGDPYECARGAHALAIVTEWQEFQELDFQRLREMMKSPVVVDLRNLLDPQPLIELGFAYQGLGHASWPVVTREITPSLVHA